MELVSCAFHRPGFSKNSFPQTSTVKSVCYTNGGGIPASSLNPSICTHIIHTFLQPDGNGNIKNSGSLTGYLANLVALKAQNPSLKILVAFGGANNVNSDWTALVSNSNSIKNFATNVFNFLKANNIDGAGESQAAALKMSFYWTIISKISIGSIPMRMRALRLIKPTSALFWSNSESPSDPATWFQWRWGPAIGVRVSLTIYQPFSVHVTSSTVSNAIIFIWVQNVLYVLSSHDLRL